MRRAALREPGERLRQPVDPGRVVQQVAGEHAQVGVPIRGAGEGVLEERPGDLAAEVRVRQVGDRRPVPARRQAGQGDGEVHDFERELLVPRQPRLPGPLPLADRLAAEGRGDVHPLARPRHPPGQRAELMPQRANDQRSHARPAQQEVPPPRPRHRRPLPAAQQPVTEHPEPEQQPRGEGEHDQVVHRPHLAGDRVLQLQPVDPVAPRGHQFAVAGVDGEQGGGVEPVHGRAERGTRGPPTRSVSEAGRGRSPRAAGFLRSAAMRRQPSLTLRVGDPAAKRFSRRCTAPSATPSTTSIGTENCCASRSRSIRTSKPPEIQRRVYAAGGPALLFENLAGCRFPACSNLFGTLERSRFLFRHTLRRVEHLVELKTDPAAALKAPWRFFDVPLAAVTTLPRKSRGGAVLKNRCRLGELPGIVSWPGRRRAVRHPAAGLHGGPGEGRRDELEPRHVPRAAGRE